MVSTQDSEELFLELQGIFGKIVLRDARGKRLDHKVQPLRGALEFPEFLEFLKSPEVPEGVLDPNFF